MENKQGEKNRKLLALAKDLAREHTDEGLDRAAEILLHLIDEGCEDPEVLIKAATYLLQGSWMSKYGTKKEAVALLDKALPMIPENLALLEAAIHGYELTLRDFPEKLNAILQLSLQILQFNPDHIESMITLADHREHPQVALSLTEAIRMMEWAQEVEPRNPYVNFTLVRLYNEAGQLRKAKRLYKQSVLNNLNVQHLGKPDQPASANPKFRNRRYRRYGSN